MNLDEKQNAESVILDSRWKIIKQNYREYGNYDFHYESQRNGEDVPKVTPEIIRNSKTGIALQGENSDISENRKILAQVVPIKRLKMR